jgi:hypothetical protein
MTTFFDKLNAEDRDNIADIIWFLKGLKVGEKSPFDESHDETLRKVISGIKDKIDFENRVKDAAKTLSN